MTHPAQVPAPTSALSWEAILVLIFTVIGGVIRLWRPQRLGLVHFDEGIYAMAGFWPFTHGGLGALDPTLISYAPPGFPFLVGLAYLGLGASDLAAILVSVIAGTLTIPATAWLARRTFGPGAGAAAAALVAFSGFHVMFSRMALTDASFLLCWTLGLICSQRFLERPGPMTALALGASTGLAQLFKYSGWLIGGVVILAALMELTFGFEARSRARISRVWGFGILAAIVAALVYAPWFSFVDSHGGYARLLEHQRGYMGSWRTWPEHLSVQLSQAEALSGGLVWNLSGTLIASLCGWAIIPKLQARRIAELIPFVLVLAGIVTVVPSAVGLLPPLLLARRTDLTKGQQILLAAWLLLIVMTPFYHPYARLWLPLHHLGWPLAAAFVLGGQSRTRDPRQSKLNVVNVASFAYLVAVIAICLLVRMPSRSSIARLFSLEDAGRPLEASDSLRLAVRRLQIEIPREVTGLRLLVRPSVTYYLSGRIAIRVEPGLARLLEGTDQNFWGLVDVAQLRQEGRLEDSRARLLSRWEIVDEAPTELNLATLLDVDPGAARTGHSEAQSAPLWLLKPRSQGHAP